MQHQVFIVIVAGLHLVSGHFDEDGTIHDISWTRNYKGMDLQERAIVDTQSRTVRMASNDPKLARLGYNQSETFHDFETMKVAVKLNDGNGNGYCFIMDIEESWTETLEELKSRAGSTINADDLDPKTVVTCDQMESRHLRYEDGMKIWAFCNTETQAGRTYSLRSYDLINDIQFRTNKIPWRYWCIFFGWEVYITIDISISIEFP